MILNTNENQIINELETESAEFTIAANAKMFDILSSKIYEDPIRAIIRELCCNAIDANIDANNDEPINVYLPTTELNSLIVEDFGIGMTHDDVLEVYRSYGKSTKTQSNKQIGALGLGGKTPLAYTQQFTLETSKDGEKNSYIIYRDENGIPNVTRVHSEKSDITGTRVEVLVKSGDEDAFHFAAAKTFLFFNKMPIIKRGEDYFYRIIYNKSIGSYSTPSTKESKSLYDAARREVSKDFCAESNHDSVRHISYIRTILKSYDAEFGIVMGQIFYKVNSQQLLDKVTYGSDAENCLHFPSQPAARFKKLIHINLGDVSFQPSREVLNYNTSTVKVLREKFYQHYIDWVTLIQQKYNTPLSFVKNYRKIPFSWKILNASHGTNDLINYTADLRDKIMHHIAKVPTDSSNFAYYCRKRNRGKSYELLSLKECEKKDTSTFKNLVTAVLEGQISILNVNEDTIIDKIISFENKAKAKQNMKRFFSPPVCLTHKLREKDFDACLVFDSKTTQKFLKDVPIISTIDSSSIIIKKVSNTNTIKGSSPRETFPEGRCYDYLKKTYIDFDAALKISKLDKVSWEFFEGTPSVTGWLYYPNWKNASTNFTGKKNENIVIFKSGKWSYCLGDKIIQLNEKIKKQLCGKVTPIIDYQHHFLIDYKFFKKNDVMNLKNWDYIETAVYNSLIKIVPELQNLVKSTTTFKIPSIFENEELVKEILSYGNSKHKLFKNTEFAKECERFLITNQNSIDFNSLKAIIMSIASEYVKQCFVENPMHNKYSRLEPIFTELEKNCDVGKTVQKTCANDSKFISKMHDDYPMTKYLTFRYYNGHEEIEDIVNYVLEHDKI